MLAKARSPSPAMDPRKRSVETKIGTMLENLEKLFNYNHKYSILAASLQLEFFYYLNVYIRSRTHTMVLHQRDLEAENEGLQTLPNNQ